jgi:peptidoglycan/LPS O-acetylase OafA/YrhL
MLFLVIFVSIPFAWQKLLPSDFVEYAESILAALFFVSNFFFFFSTTEYGGGDALLKPFLHTWSLGVEEQFYLIFPIFAIIAFKFARQHFLTILIAIALLSLQFADLMEVKNSNLNFYLPFSRFWELAVGSALAYRELSYKHEKNGFLHKVLPIFGLYLIMYSILFFDNNTPHPSFHTIIPILGVSLIIIFSSKEELVGKVLGSKPFVWVGLISYSVYLWHFPIFAFLRMGKEPTNYDKLEWILLTFALAIISYLFIEKPFRNRELVTKRFFLASIMFSLVLVIAFSSYVLKSDGARFFDPLINLSGPPSLKVDADIAVIGDSHAGHLSYGLSVLTGGRTIMKDSGGCIPFRDVDRFDYRFKVGGCATHTNNALNEIIKSAPIKTVVMSTMGPVYLDNTAFQKQGLARITKQDVVDMQNRNVKDRYVIFENGFRRTIKELVDSGKKVVFVIDVPELGKQFHTCIKNNYDVRWRPFGPFVEGKVVDKAQCRYERQLYDERAGKYRSLIAKLMKEHTQVVFVDPLNSFCDSTYCYGYKNSTLLYRDVDHLNQHGSLLVGELILKSLVANEKAK